MQESPPPSWLVSLGLTLLGAAVGFLTAFWRFASGHGALKRTVEDLEEDQKEFASKGDIAHLHTEILEVKEEQSRAAQTLSSLATGLARLQGRHDRNDGR